MVKRSQKKAPATVTKNGSRFPIKFFFTLSILISSVLIYADIEQNGSWKASKTFNILKETGLNEYGNKVINKTHLSVQWVNSQIEKQYPGFEKRAAELSEPYIDLAKDLGVISCNLFSRIRGSVIQGYPIVVQTIETYAPGLLEKIQKTASTIFINVKDYSNKGLNYLKNEVFVGQLSPENMLDVSVQILKTIQYKVYEGYLWVSEKIQQMIK